MNGFQKQFAGFLESFGQGRKMVLSTAAHDIVSSRMMSVVRLDGAFYFQTDQALRKYRQLSVNPRAALCIDNIQIEGICAELGAPLAHAAFCAAFRTCFRGSYDAYTALENERLFVLHPTRIERWLYLDGVPYIEIFDIENERCCCEKYTGV